MLCLGVTIERKELSLRSIQVHFKIWRPKKKKNRKGEKIRASQREYGGGRVDLWGTPCQMRS
jgi:hypothetical protein